MQKQHGACMDCRVGEQFCLELVEQIENINTQVVTVQKNIYKHMFLLYNINNTIRIVNMHRQG